MKKKQYRGKMETETPGIAVIQVKDDAGFGPGC